MYRTPKDLLAIDVKKMDEEHFRLRRQAVRDRFVIGLLTALEAHPGLGWVYMDLDKKAEESILGAPSLKEFQDQTSTSVLSEAQQKLWASFKKSMGSTRKAIGGTSEISKETLRSSLPCFFGGQPFEQAFLVFTCHELLEDPAMKLDQAGLAEVRGMWLEQQLPAQPSAPRVRL